MGSHFTGSDMSSTLKTLGGYTSFTVSDRCILWKSLFDLVCQQQQQLSTKNQKCFSSLSCQPTLQEQQLTLLLGTFHSRGEFIVCLFVCLFVFLGMQIYLPRYHIDNIVAPKQPWRLKLLCTSNISIFHVAFKMKMPEMITINIVAHNDRLKSIGTHSWLVLLRVTFCVPFLWAKIFKPSPVEVPVHHNNT
jgi:hypothetical protein